MGKKEDNQFLRMLFQITIATLIGTISYLGAGTETRFFVILALVFCVILCILSLVIITKKHKENSDEIED